MGTEYREAVPPDARVLSGRIAPKIEALYAIIVTDRDGVEGIARRDTPSGTQPWITDDPALVGPLLAFAHKGMPQATLRVVRFVRQDAAQ
jgi:hypothetical protein